MTNKNNISALSYLSVLFMPILVPVIIYFVEKDEDVRYHTKRALLSHILPLFIGLIILGIFAIFSYANIISNGLFIVSMIALIIIYGIVMCAIAVWNIFQVVKLMR